ncbi:unnamed protein product [Rhizophagus irregularis]|nr:unnamed protein product [Rhizophagus irregularis]CAB5295449.1 unnamed protein product [Rhizophagus irregularis]
MTIILINSKILVTIIQIYPKNTIATIDSSKGSKDSSGAVAPVDNLKNTNNSSEASAGIDSPKDYLKIKENHQSQVFRIISKPSYRLTKERISNWAHMI